MKRLALEMVSLQTARGRLLTFLGLTAAVFVSHYHWLDHLSLWGNLGFKHAPSVGLTRAYWLLLHGQPVAAWHRNWLIYLILCIGLPLLARDIRAMTYPHSKKTPKPQFVL